MRRRCLMLLEGAGLFLAGGLLFLFPAQSAQGARAGVDLCLNLLIPALFPFFVLSSLFISTGLAQTCSQPLEGIMRRMFGVSGPGAAAFCLGLIGGYPAGARAIAQLMEQGACSQRDAQRLSLFCNNCGPAFFLGAVGVGVFQCKNAGFLLLGANLLAALLIGLLTNLLLGSVKNDTQPTFANIKRASCFEVFPDCVRSAFSATLGVCAYVILFSVVAALADCTGLLPAIGSFIGQLLPCSDGALLGRSVCMGLLEISTGAAALQGSECTALALPLAAFLLGWGGLSVHCQSLPFWRQSGVQMAPYLKAKLLQGALSAGFTALGMLLLPFSLPAMVQVEPTYFPALPSWEVTGIWLLSGVYFFFHPPKKSGKKQKDAV
jgi:sporulation integral membrane protein YlbJ